MVLDRSPGPSISVGLGLRFRVWGLGVRGEGVRVDGFKGFRRVFHLQERLRRSFEHGVFHAGLGNSGQSL